MATTREYEFIDPVQIQLFQTCDPEKCSDDKVLYGYLKQAIASEGFDVDDDPESDLTSDIRPTPISSEGVVTAANFAVEEFNGLKGADLKLRRIVKANSALFSGFLYYLRLKCWDGCFYEVKVYKPFKRRSVLDIFRPAKYYPISSSSSKSEESKNNSLLNISGIKGRTWCVDKYRLKS